MSDNYCTVCGKFHNGSACPGALSELETKNNIGWECPVCGCGNAPYALTCGRCTPKNSQLMPTNPGKSNFQHKVNKINNISPSFIEVEVDPQL